ncbi:MAG: hypothetical protein WCW61_04495 [Patescibacteria group bacterium]|jgi:hypothetical protein
MTKHIFLKNLLRSSNQNSKKVVASDLENESSTRKNHPLSNFEDWLRAATRGRTSDLHAEDWLGLALGYSPKKAVKELHLFFGVIKARPLLAEQAKALLLSLPANLLPALKILQKLTPEDEEQQKVKESLIRKKTLGDEAFWREHFQAIVWEDEFGRVSFPVGSGNRIVRDPWPGQQRLATVYGLATVVSLVDKSDQEEGDGFHVFILVDGEIAARKHGSSKLEKILVTD